MNGSVFIADCEIGIVDFKVIDESMGTIGGDFVAAENYSRFKKVVQNLTDKNGNANSENFKFRILIDNVEFNPICGICLTDSEEFAEMYLDVARLNQNELEKVKG
jgi:hypothetical protein